MEITKELKAIKDLTPGEIEQVHSVISPYYIDSTALVRRALDRNTLIYLLKDTAGNLLSYFMVNWEKHLVGSELRDVVYLGLSCTRPDYNQKKLASRVYYYFTADAFAYEQQTGTKLILYGTTATPVVLLTVPKIWHNVKPGLDGSYNEQDKTVIEALKKSVGHDKYSGDHPFVLKQVAHNTRYAPAEDERLRQFIEKNKIDTFRKMGIDELNGDRMLITMEVPDQAGMEQLRIKLFG